MTRKAYVCVFFITGAPTHAKLWASVIHIFQRGWLLKKDNKHLPLAGQKNGDEGLG